MRPYLLLILVLFSLTAISQRQFPSISGTVDVHLDNAYQFHQQKDSAKTAGELHIVQQQMASLNDAYPYYRGIVSLFLSFYDFNKNNQQSFRNQATSLLKNADHLLADSFASAFYNVMYLHYQHKRMGEWLALDSMFRTSIRNKLKQSNFRYLFADYAQAKLEEKEYFISNKLASYEYYMLMYNDSKEPMDDLTLVYVDWLITKGDLEQWLDLPYEYRHPKEYAGHTVSIQPHNLDSDFNRSLRDHDFKKTFNTLISRIKEIKEVCIEKNNYDQASVNRPLRRGYYQVYMEILNGFHSWAVNEHKEGQVILPLKSFLMLDLIPNEIENASIHKVSTEVTSRAFLSLVDKLSKVYHAVGNGQDEKEIIMQGLRVYLDKNVFSEDELFYAIGSLLENRVSAERLLRNYEGSLATSQSLKKRTSRPDSVSKRYMNRWELFMKARIEEVYTLVESGQPRAWDSLGKLLNETTLLDDGSSNAPIYSSKSWPHMQYLIALMKARKGDWWTTLLMESIVDMENLPTLPDLYYPVQLFYFKALWHKEKKIDTKVLTNLIFYTGRQLRHTFMMMSAEERMILYEQRLSGYFDVYHELLFSGMADAHPEIKDQLIAQSLSLKNLLADGNLIPNELLQKNQAGRSLESIEKLRALRQEVNLVVQQSKFLKYDVTTRQLMKDRIHIMWLELLEGAGMDSLIKLTDWKQIAAKLSTGQIYTETVRYNKWLSDSTAWYGAYAITSEGKMSLVKLYPESKIEKLLNDPAASQQTAAINVDGNRGNKILSKKGKPGEKKFKQGDVDKLAALILEPLWPLVQNKTEWYQVQDGLLNRISFAALQWKTKNLFEYLQLNQLSGSASLFRSPMKLQKNAMALLAGGLHYGNSDRLNVNRLFKKEYNWDYLPGTKKEVNILQPVFASAGLKTNSLSGNNFPDSLLNELKQYHVIHLATHGFYLDSASAATTYASKFSREALRYEPLFRCGIAMSNANDPEQHTTENDGYLLGYELANADLRNCYLISLSACETGLGDLRNNLGVDGLSRALKLGGARHLLISLWKVPDQPTAVFMEVFYKNLFAGITPSKALNATQAFMSKTHPASDWAAFVLVD